MTFKRAGMTFEASKNKGIPTFSRMAYIKCRLIPHGVMNFYTLPLENDNLIV